MTTFSPLTEIPEDIELVKDDDKVRINIGETDTIGYNVTEDGISITPDWTDRRFTLTLLADAAFFHVTEEGGDEWKREEARHLPHEGLIAEFYDSLRKIGKVSSGSFRPITMFNVNRLYRWDIDEAKELLVERDVVEFDGDDVRVDSVKANELMTKADSSVLLRTVLFWRVLEAVSVEEAKKSDHWLYVSPRLNCFVLVYPDGYACKLAPGDLRAAIHAVTSSRWGDAIMQTTESFAE